MASPVLIAVATYRRPERLTRLLDSLQRSIEAAGARDDVDLVVVDNDPDASARAPVQRHPIGARWLHQPDPGIVPARNRALDEFDERYRAVVFIDDDEWVDPDWFQRLTDYQKESGADVVRGPQFWELPADAPGWAVRGEWFRFVPMRTGERQPSAGTNNTLLMRAAWLRCGAPRFDPEFSVTGSSDWEFFWGLRKAGAVIEYCAEAVAHEEIAPERMTRRWAARRWLGYGANHARVMRKHGDSLAWPLLRAVLVIGKHGLLLPIDLLLGRGLRGPRVKGIVQPAGWWAGAFGWRPGQYRRPTG